LQIWIIPDERDAEPNYQQINLDPRKDPNKWHLIAGPDANAPMHIRQNAEVKSAVLKNGHELTVDTVKKVNYVH
ncbi:pirin family protein, partial [Acinetobacter sp. 11520]|nr:pirin family protein [Acinetobacter sp. 11520]